jgi:hypothetical protein
VLVTFVSCLYKRSGLIVEQLGVANELFIWEGLLSGEAAGITVFLVGSCDADWSGRCG